MKKLLTISLLICSLFAKAQFLHTFPENKCTQCDYADKLYPPSFNWPYPKINSSTSPKYMMVTGPPGAFFGDPSSTPTSLALVSTGEYGAPQTIFGNGDMYRMKVDKINAYSYRTELYTGDGGGGNQSAGQGYSDTKWFMAGIYIPADWCTDDRPMGVLFDMKYPDAVGPPSFFLRLVGSNFVVARKFPQNGSEIQTTVATVTKGAWHYFLLHRNFTENSNPSNVEGGTGGYMVLRHWKQGTTPTFTKIFEHYGGNYVNYAPDPSLTEGYWLTGPYNWPWNNDSEGQGPCNTSLTLYYKHIFTAKSTATLQEFNDFISGSQTPSNIPPLVANMDPINVAAPSTTTGVVNATASDADGTIVSYSWTQLAGGPNTATITNATSEDPTFSNLIDGSYTFQLTVTDNNGATGSGTIVVTRTSSTTTNGPRFTRDIEGGCNQTSYGSGGCPVLALPDRSITSPKTTDTTTFYAVHGDAGRHIQSFSARYISSPGGTSPTETQYPPQNTYIPTEAHWAFAGLTANGTYEVEVTATDDQGSTKVDTFNIVRSSTANTPPSVSAGSDQKLYVDAVGPFQSTSTTLYGTSSDADGIESKKWTKVSGPDNTSFSAATSDTTSATMLAVGSYIFRYTVTDNLGLSAYDDVAVTVISCNAGVDTTVLASVNVPLKGTYTSGSTVSSIAWTKVSGTGGTISNASTLNATATGLTAGTYVFQLRITFTDGNTVIDNKEVKVINGILLKEYLFLEIKEP